LLSRAFLRRRIHPSSQARLLRLATVDFLESRRMLSVSASTLAGSFDIVGNVVSSQLLSSSSVLATLTATVIGPATFNGQSCVETDIASIELGGAATTTTVDYGNLTSAGLAVIRFDIYGECVGNNHG